MQFGASDWPSTFPLNRARVGCCSPFRVLGRTSSDFWRSRPDFFAQLRVRRAKTRREELQAFQRLGPGAQGEGQGEGQGKRCGGPQELDVGGHWPLAMQIAMQIISYFILFPRGVRHLLTAPLGSPHHALSGLRCALCGKNIVGPRFRCIHCADYSACPVAQGGRPRRARPKV